MIGLAGVVFMAKGAIVRSTLRVDPLNLPKGGQKSDSILTHMPVACDAKSVPIC